MTKPNDTPSLQFFSTAESDLRRNQLQFIVYYTPNQNAPSRYFPIGKTCSNIFYAIRDLFDCFSRSCGSKNIDKNLIIWHAIIGGKTYFLPDYLKVQTVMEQLICYY